MKRIGWLYSSRILYSLGDDSGYLVKTGKEEQYRGDTSANNIAYDDFEIR